MLPLRKDQVHIWQANLAQSEAQIATFWSLLSTQEKQRAQRFKFPEHRNYFVVSKAILRKILSNYLKLSPKEIIFDKGAQGKPLIQNPDTTIFFNVSHSADQALYAISNAQEVGIDIEKIKERKHDFMEIAERFFAAEEKDYLKNLPDTQQLTAFFQLWTRKEAVIKALGLGLSFPLEQFAVAETCTDFPQVLFHVALPDKAAWRVYDLATRAGFAAALAVATPVELQYFTF